MMKQSKIEQETIILFNEGEADAEVYTHNVKLKNNLVSRTLSFEGQKRIRRRNVYFPEEIPHDYVPRGNKRRVKSLSEIGIRERPT